METSEQKYKDFVSIIGHKISHDRIYTDDLRRLCWGTDAGFYRMLPRVVVRVKDEDEVIKVLTTAAELDIPLTFRAAGTSLSARQSPTPCS